jgi:hypothetical protein
MPVVLPDSPRQLRWLLARRLSVAALIIGFAAGGASYLFETRRAELAALQRVADSARHFESPAMQLAINAKVLRNMLRSAACWIEPGLSVFAYSARTER